MRKNTLDLKTLTKTSIYLSLLCISSFIFIPLPFTPITLTLHTIIINIIALTLHPKNATLTIIIYLLMGLIGLPVFSGGTSGIAKILGPTGGFYFGFLFSTILISLLKGKNNKISNYILTTTLIGIPIQHLFAILFMCFYNNLNIISSFLTVSLPFIIGDVIKAIIASIISTSINKNLKQ